MTAGTEFRVAYDKPGNSGLNGVLVILNGAGAEVATGLPGASPLDYTVPAGQSGAYFAGIRAGSAEEPGLMSQYLLRLEIRDQVAPLIVGDTLPVEGGTVPGLFDRFTLTFTEDMSADTVNAPSSYELRASGPDNQFDTTDDVLWAVAVSPAYGSGLTPSYRVVGGALQPGEYRFIARNTLRDRAGNALGTAFSRQFTVMQVPGFATEKEPNDTRETATPLVMTSTQGGLWSGGGRGYLRDGNDWDYWSFEAEPGDVVVLSAETPGHLANSGLYYQMLNPEGGQLLLLNAENNGLLQTAPLTLTTAGVYTVRITQWHGYYGEHRIRVSLYRAGLAVELEPNNGISNATAVSYTESGSQKTAVIGGYTQLDSDLDYFNLGFVEAGKTIFLRTRQPVGSPVNPVVSLYNSANTYQTEAGSGRPSDGVAEVRITQSGTYYALVRASSGTAGLMSEYVLDVLVVPTEDVVIPNLQVTVLQVPVTTGLRSGDPFTFVYTVANVGTLATPVNVWFDRAVLSTDPVMDAGDIQLGLDQHTGALAPGASYARTNTVTLPDGVGGDFYLIVRTDYTDTVNEFLLEGDNETATENPFAIQRADYPDLVIEDLTLTGPVGQTYTLSWSTFNRGTASTGTVFKDRIRVRHLTTAATVLEQTHTNTAPLAVDAGIPRQVQFTAGLPGQYLVEVVTDADQDIYEFDAVGHASAENNTATTAFAITQVFTVNAGVSPAGAGTVTGAGSYSQGASVTVTATPVTTQAPYTFLHWSEGGVVRSSNPTYTFTANANANLVAVFALPSFQLAAANQPAGAGTVLGTGSYLWGTTNALFAQAAFGYRFSHWTEDGSSLGSNAVLQVPVFGNRLVTAHYVDAHLVHVVTTATLPAGLAPVSGAGTYDNGQSTTLSAPATVTNSPPDHYAFQRFTLNGAFFGTNASFNKTFATTDATNMNFVAEYIYVDRTPPVLGPVMIAGGVTTATLSWTNNEATSARIAYGTTSGYGTTNSVATLRTQHTFVLTGLASATAYHARVFVTDAHGNTTESGDLTFSTQAPPDLVAGAVTVPASAQAGTLIPLTYVITNIGPGVAAGSWQNAVLLSSNSDGSGAQLVGSVNFNPGAAGIAPGASLSVTQQVIVPSVGTGPRYLGVRIDSGGQLFELDENNNTAFAAAPLNIVATDLRVARVNVPANASFGQGIPVELVITNAGTAPVVVPWIDRIYLGTVSNTPTTLLGSANALTVPLPPGGTYTNTVLVTLPLAGGSAAGQHFITVVTDQSNDVPESDEGNNVGSAALNLSLPPLPDLAVLDLVAPANAQPGETVSLLYTVTNRGGAAAGPVWSETFLFATNNAGAGRVELATVRFTNELAAGVSLVRTQAVVVPAGGLVGALWFVVQVDGRSEVIEVDETNNLQVAPASTLVPAELSLSLSVAQIPEGASQPIVATVTRNGSRAGPLTVTLNNSHPSELAVPAQVVIPAGAASATFNIQSQLDGVVDGPRLVTVGASAGGFGPASASVTVLDVDLPQLSFLVVTNVVREGRTLMVTVNRDTTVGALAVALSGSAPTQLAIPGGVTIPDGQAGVTFVAQALDDSAVEPRLVVQLTASANGYRGTTQLIEIEDDDWPVLELVLTPLSFSEGAGPQAAVGTLTREMVSPRGLAVELESSDTNLVRVPRAVLIPAGETTVTFPVSAVDNLLVDGTRTAEIRAWFRASGSSTRLGQSGAGSVTVTDDDGPTLTLTADRSVLPEGLTPAGTGTVTRNTGTNGTLVVTLVSGNTNELRVPQTVTILPGAIAANFPLNTVEDGESDGNQRVTLVASATDYTGGNLALTVTDVNLPDLVVSSVTVPALAETEAFVDVGYQIRNQGVAASPSNSVVQRVYLSTDSLVGDDVLLGQFAFNGALPVGAQFGQTLPIRLPQAAGDYWIVVVTDATDGVVELLEDNNVRISTSPIRVAPAYTATVSTTLESAPSGTPVPLTGEARRPGGQPAVSSLVSIHIRVRDTVRTIAALTDALGRFSANWQPLPGEAGFYQVSAGHPGEPVPEAQDGFRLLGLRSVPANPSVRLSEGSSVGGSFRLENLSDVPLTGMQAEVVSQPPNVNVTLTLESDVIDGAGGVQLGYGVSATDASFTWGFVQVRVTSAEGAELLIPMRVDIDALVPRLVAQPGRLEGGMQRGVSRTVSFVVMNPGGLPTGPVTVSLPPLPWMSLVSPNPIPSLAPGASNVVTVQLNPPADLPLTVHSGNLALNGTGVGIAVPFSYRALSDGRGTLEVTAVNEFTYYAAGSPPLTNATVRIRDAVTQAVITNGVTDGTGRFVVPDLMEGYYDLELDAVQHNGHRSTVLIEPGATNSVSAFLSYQAVRYSWTVERIEIEDNYRITIETTFETVVPAPVVTVEPAVLDVGDLLVVGQTKQVNMTFRNRGLIRADDIKLGFTSHPFYSIEPLITDLGSLPAQGSLTIPVTLRRIGDFSGASGLVRGASGVPCGMSGGAAWSFQCGPLTIGGGAPVGVSGVVGDCGGPRGGGTPGGGWLGWGGPSGPSGGTVNTSYSSPSFGIKVGCDPACLLLAAAGCIPGPIGCFASGFSCGMSLGDGVSALDVLDCGVGAVGCLVPGAGIPACIYSITRCFITPVSAGSNVLISGPESDPIEFYRVGVRAQMDAFNIITGSPDGVWLNPSADTTTGDWYARFQTVGAAGSDGGRTITATERAGLLEGVQPPGVDSKEVIRLIERWNRTVEMLAQGIVRPSDAPSGSNLDFIDTVELQSKLVLASAYHAEAVAAGFTDPINAIVETYRIRSQEGEEGGVCAKVKIKLDQAAVLSREAFRATLEIDNATANSLEDIRVVVRVTDSQGNDADAMFGLRAPELTGLTDVDGNGRVVGGASGTARWVLVPTVDAAPLEPTVYFVGGEFRYTLNGLLVTVPLAPVPITVNPTARLTLDYFHQRDVYSDDPFTDQVEPSIPFNLAIMVQNRGAGEAKNFRITSAQPEIVENEKGLLIDFRIIATEVAGQNMTPTLTANFGTIPPGGISVARWLMTSTLQGLFIDYKATFEHLDGQGNPRLSLIDEVRIHEMTRLVQAGGSFEDGKPDFLVNNIPDLRDLPDTLWLSDGSSNRVEVVTNAVVTGALAPGNLQVQLTAAMPPGWSYLRVPDPANGAYRLVGVRRSDNIQVGVETNVWVTDRTFIGLGRRPALENILHLLDHNSTGQYTLTYEALPVADDVPPVSSVSALPETAHAAFPVQWAGQDNAGGSGIASYDIYYSVDGGPFVRWLAATSSSGSVFQGSLGRTYAFYSVAVDRSGNREVAPAAPQARTTVILENRAPVLASQSDVTIVEGETLSLSMAATDPDGDALTYQLGEGAPAGVVLDASSGLLTWNTGELHGPSTNQLTVVVRDSGVPPMTASRTFRVIVLESNLPPVLEPIPNFSLGEGRLLSFTAVATDSDLPLQKLTFSLGAGAPAGAVIHPDTGSFTWVPSEFQGGTNYTVTVVVHDDGIPGLSASQSFAVAVLDTRSDFRVKPGTTAALPNTAGSVALQLDSGATLEQVLFTFGIGGDRLTDIQLTDLAPQVGAADLVPLGGGRYRATFNSRSGEWLQGNFPLARLSFNVTPSSNSSVVNIRGESLTGVRIDGLTATGQGGAGRVFVVGVEPMLDIEDLDEQVGLTLYAVPGKAWLIEQRDAFGSSGPWSLLATVIPTALRTDLPPRPAVAPGEFFRARSGDDPGLVNILWENDQVVMEWSLDCVGCVLLQSPVIGPGAVWTPTETQPQVVGDRYRVTLPAGGQTLFLRLQPTP